eukprot:3018759-Pyramimonas_sp.AAC.1
MIGLLGCPLSWHPQPEGARFGPMAGLARGAPQGGGSAAEGEQGPGCRSPCRVLVALLLACWARPEAL